MRKYQDSINRPRLLLAFSDAPYASQCGRYFRRLGWEVQMVASGAEARMLAVDYRPDVVVLAAELLDESGWLTSAKVSIENRDLRMIVVGKDTIAVLLDRIAMVGAEHAVRRSD